jgi:hypothetical protein
MPNLTKDDLLLRRDFESNLNTLREQFQAVLQKRRYLLGPSLIVSFFNRDMAKYRLEQLLWAERISDESILDDYLNSFNQLIPGDSELVAEILLKFEQKTEIQTILEQFKNLEQSRSLFLSSDTHDKMYPDYLPQKNNSTTHCVYYVRFQLSGKNKESLSNQNLSLVIDRDPYNYQVQLDAELL